MKQYGRSFEISSNNAKTLCSWHYVLGTLYNNFHKQMSSLILITCMKQLESESLMTKNLFQIILSSDIY